MALRRPRIEQRSFDLDPLHDQPRSLVILGAHFLDLGRNRAQAVGDDSNRLPPFHLLGELDHGRLFGRHFEVVDQVLLRRRIHRTGLDVKHDGLVGLKSVTGNAEPVLARLPGLKLPQRDLNIGGNPGAEDRDAVVEVAINATAGLDGLFVLDVVAPLDGTLGRRPLAMAASSTRSAAAR